MISMGDIIQYKLMYTIRSSIATFEEMMAKNDNLNLFHRGDKEAQDKQLKQMNFKADFFSKHQAYVPYTRKTNDK